MQRQWDSRQPERHIHTVKRYPDREAGKQTHRQNTEDSVKRVNIRDKDTHNNTGVSAYSDTYEGWNFNSGNYLFTTDTK